MNAKESKRHLVEQVASSHYLAKSARLREMFTYVCDRVLEHSAAEIHEQEVGHHVFGRPADYDTTDDNTVRVHASMLRKRIDQYFATEGSSEPVIIEIPRGNYAPKFRERPVAPAVAPPVFQPNLAPPLVSSGSESVAIESQAKWKIWVPSVLAALFASLSFFLVLYYRGAHTVSIPLKGQPTVSLFWSQMLPAGKRLDIVVSDASLGTFQEMTNQPVSLSEYFDRSYMNKVEDRAIAAKVDPAFAASLVLKRESNYGEVALLAKIGEIAKTLRSDTTVQFARDYSFRQLKTDNAVLLGYPISDPWIEPFENYLTLRWKYDPVRTHYYVVDTTATDKQKSGTAPSPDQSHESYATLSFVPNLSNTGNILILSGTGGAASGAALDFLSDEHSMIQLHDLLTHDKKAPFPHFEALLKVGGHNSVPRNSSIILCRHLKP